MSVCSKKKKNDLIKLPVNGFILVTLHLSSMKTAKQTSLILLGTTTTNCFKASGTAKLSDWLAGPGSEVAAVAAV